MAPVKAVESGLAKVREYLPFSDAKVGPLSSLTASGQALLGSVAQGFFQNSQDLELSPLQGFLPSPILSAGQGMMDGIMNLVPKLNSSLVPNVLQAALSLSPVMASEAPPLNSTMPVALESRVEKAQTAVSPVLPIANTTTPQTNATMQD